METLVDNIPIPIDCLKAYYELPPEGKASFKKIISNTEDYSFVSMQNIVVELDIDLRCSIQKTHLRFPARSKSCTHADAIDLFCIIKKFYGKEQNSKECPSCKVPIANIDTDVKIDRCMKGILDTVSPDVNSVRYNFKEKEYYVVTDTNQLGGSKDIFFDVITQNKRKYETDPEHGTKLLKKLTKNKINTTISLLCKLSGKRMNYACRFSKCEHLECFDFEQLIKHFEGGDIVWKCPAAGCSATTRKPKSEIEIDKMITAECLTLNKNVREVVFNSARKKFLAMEECKDRWYDTLQDPVESKKELMQVFYKRELQTLIGNYQAQAEHQYSDSVKNYIKEAQAQGRKTIEINLLDPVMNIPMNIPAKFKICQHIECCELNTYVANYAKGIKACPICGLKPDGNIEGDDNEGDDSEDESIEPSEAVQIDVFTIKALDCLSVSNAAVYFIKEDVFIPKDSQDLEDTAQDLKGFSSTVTKDSQLLIRFASLIDKNPPIDRESPFYKNTGKSFKFNLASQICKNDTMKDPIIMPGCLHHACMDLSEYVQERPKICCAPNCGKKIEEDKLTTDLVMIEVLKAAALINLRGYTGEYLLAEKKIITKTIAKTEAPQMPERSVILQEGEDLLTSMATSTSKKGGIKIVSTQSYSPVTNFNAAITGNPKELLDNIVNSQPQRYVDTEDRKESPKSQSSVPKKPIKISDPNPQPQKKITLLSESTILRGNNEKVPNQSNTFTHSQSMNNSGSQMADMNFNSNNSYGDKTIYIPSTAEINAMTQSRLSTTSGGSNETEDSSSNNNYSNAYGSFNNQQNSGNLTSSQTFEINQPLNSTLSIKLLKVTVNNNPPQ
jgi:hypothetical protein